MPSQSEGRRTFVGLTVHGRLEGKHESRLQSSPAEGLTVTKAEADRRGEAGDRAFIKGRIRGCSPCLRQGRICGGSPPRLVPHWVAAR